MEDKAGIVDQRYAEWYAWARRTLGADSRDSLAAAQAALDVLLAGGGVAAADEAARSAARRYDTILLTRVPERRRQYAERYYETASVSAAQPAPFQPLPEVAQPADLAGVPAGFGRRLGAASIDTAIQAVMLVAVTALAILVAAMVDVVRNTGPTDDISAGLALLGIAVAQPVLAWLYAALLHSSPWQATIGKRLLGLRVTDLQGRRISFLRASGRHVASSAIYLTLGIGFLVIIVKGSRQGLHDLLARTLVVRTGQNHREGERQSTPVTSASVATNTKRDGCSDQSTLRGAQGAAMSLTARAVLAIVLTVGFYALALGVTMVLVLLVVSDVTRGHIRKGTLYAGAGAVALGWSILPRPNRFRPPGPHIDLGANPQLAAHLGDVAQRVGEAMPADVYLTMEMNAGVAQRGGLFSWRQRRYIVLGLPLIQVLTISELRAVLAHEFGHFRGGDTRLGPLIYRARGAIARSVRSTGSVSVILWLPFRGYAALFFRITQAVSRAQEFAADALAASAVGARTLATGLRKLAAYSVCCRCTCATKWCQWSALGSSLRSRPASSTT